MRLLVVSNRLPMTVAKTDEGFALQTSMGGLVSGLSAYLDSLRGSSLEETEYVWVGWPGLTVEENRQAELRQVIEGHHAYPVFLSEHEMDQFYHGFCNKTLWPLFHYFPTYAQYHDEYWERYRAVNRIFADTVCTILEPDDVVWIHDYHLMLLPAMIRKARPNLPIGFFLHIPFPSYEILRVLPRPWRHALVDGMLGADLIGFHTDDYRNYFLRSVRQDLGIPTERNEVPIEGRRVRVEGFPMGIDYDKYNEAASSLVTLHKSAELRQAWPGHKLILSVDRLDYSKGISHRLQGWQLFLERYPEWQGQVTLLLVVVPSRIGVEHYQEIKRQIDELVGAINGRFGTLHWTPIVYRSRYLPFAELVSLYAACDVALITPLRDGMNLVAKEYLAARADGTGVLILSEMAGAAQELREALLINPCDWGEIAAALAQAVAMSTLEQRRRNAPMRARLEQNNVMRWAHGFLETLQDRALRKRLPVPAFLGEPPVLQQLARDIRQARQRLLLLDYDGTLVPFASFPEAARPPEDLLQTLATLQSQDRTEVVVISGRDRRTLERWFASVPYLTLVAEHGLWTRLRDGEWSGGPSMPADWRNRLRTLMERYTEDVPGTFIEEKDASMAWHFRAAAQERALQCAAELRAEIEELHLPDIRITLGHRVLEVRTGAADKGTAARQLAQGADLVLAFGDDVTDEDVFQELGPEAYTIKVGRGPSAARFRVTGPDQVLRVLDLIGDILCSPEGTPLDTTGFALPPPPPSFLSGTHPGTPGPILTPADSGLDPIEEEIEG